MGCSAPPARAAPAPPHSAARASEPRRRGQSQAAAWAARLPGQRVPSLRVPRVRLLRCPPRPPLPGPQSRARSRESEAPPAPGRPGRRPAPAPSLVSTARAPRPASAATPTPPVTRRYPRPRRPAPRPRRGLCGPAVGFLSAPATSQPLPGPPRLASPPIPSLPEPPGAGPFRGGRTRERPPSRAGRGAAASSASPAGTRSRARAGAPSLTRGPPLPGARPLRLHIPAGSSPSPRLPRRSHPRAGPAAPPPPARPRTSRHTSRHRGRRRALGSGPVPSPLPLSARPSPTARAPRPPRKTQPAFEERGLKPRCALWSARCPWPSPGGTGPGELSSLGWFGPYRLHPRAVRLAGHRPARIGHRGRSGLPSRRVSGLARPSINPPR